MKSLLILSLIFLVFTSVHSQSKIQIEKDRALYRDNKVKKETITEKAGSKEITKYNKKGNPVELMRYNPDKSEANITKYFYDKFDNLINQSYTGVESGDIVETSFYYDNTGNVMKVEVLGGDYNEIKYIYDKEGNLIEMVGYDISETASKPDIYYYNNFYVEGKLVSTEDGCTVGRDEAFVTNYIYSQNNLAEIDVFNKNCVTGNLTFYSTRNYTYFENGLIKEQNFRSSYFPGEMKFTYSYEFY